MMDEISNIHNAISPQETLFIVSEMTDEDAFLLLENHLMMY